MFSAHHSGEFAINTRRTAALAAAVVLGALSLPGTATAAPTDLYVDKSAPHCADAGHGTQAQPYCTVSAAANAVLPGQTVHIAAGNYAETVTVTRSGTADAPITFTGARSGTDGLQPHQTPTYRNQITYTTIGSTMPGGHGLVLQGASHLRFQNLSLMGDGGTVAIDGGSDVQLTHNYLDLSPDAMATVDVQGGASALTISQNVGQGNPFVYLHPGVRGTVITTNAVQSHGQVPAVIVDSAPDTVVVSNTLTRDHGTGISIGGSATSATVENNVVSSPVPGDPTDSPFAVSVAADAVSSTKVAYNAYGTGATPLYRWADKTYDTVAAFTAATGQGNQDAVGDVTPTPVTGDSGDVPHPEIDSADESAPGMLDTDILGTRPVKDPFATGTGTRDRGAFEIDNFAARYTPVGPVRLLDTRTSGVAVAPGGTVDLPIPDAAGLTAVTMNVTVTKSTAPGFLIVYPHGADRPTASNLNWTAGETIPNLVTTQVKDGKVSFYNGSWGTVHVIADLLGRYTRAGSGYHTTAPTRLLDTRTANQPLTPGKPLDLTIPGPADITAVTLNMTVTRPTDRGFLTVYPHGTKQPTASNLNWTAGETIPNLVTVPVKDGKITLVTGGTNGTTHVVADLAGYFTASGGDRYHALTPYRMIDTRKDAWIASDWTDSGPIGLHPGPVDPGASATFRTGLTTGQVDAVAMNVTVTGGTAPGFLTVHPGDTALPVASNLNWTAGETIPNQVVVTATPTSPDQFFNGSSGPVHVVSDVNGYYAP